MMHICIGKLTITISDNGLPACWQQAIIRTNAGILLMGPIGINFSEILVKIKHFIEENTFQNVISEILSISSQP